MFPKRLLVYSLFLQSLAALGVTACSSGGGNLAGLPGSGSGDALEKIEWLNCPTQALRPGEGLQLSAEGRTQSGGIVSESDLNADYRSDNNRFASIDAQGKVVALYPGEAQLTAEAEGKNSAPCVITILPPEILGDTQRLTNNLDEDHWGQNNSWPMTARGQVLWQRVDGNLDTEVLLHDREDAVGIDTQVDFVDMQSGDVDFMALGSGTSGDDILASYRVNLSLTHVSENGDAPLNLGDQQQEENSIADGCFFFREGGGFNDIQRYTPTAGLIEILSAGQTYGPITSGCEAVWENRGIVDSELVFFDGQTLLPIANGLPVFPDYDFRNRRAVYASQGDVTLVDLTQNPPLVLPLTSDGMTRLDRNPRTDGESVVWLQIDGAEQHIWMYDIASGALDKISVTSAPKKLDSLQIDLKQVLWVEGTELWFHAGSGDVSDTDSVDLLGLPLDPNYRPYLKDGLATWVANDGDTEILVME